MYCTIMIQSHPNVLLRVSLSFFNVIICYGIMTRISNKQDSSATGSKQSLDSVISGKNPRKGTLFYVNRLTVNT